MSLLTRKLEQYVDINLTTQDVFTELANDRLIWQPIDILDEPLAPITGARECFNRIVALGLELELPVGSFIRAAIERVSDIPKTAIKGMIENIIDEEKHFDAFSRISNVYTPTEYDLISASIFRQELLHFSYNPIAKARDLETLVFLPIQAILRVYGGEALERVVADISHDEYRHTNFGWELSTVLKIHRNRDFESICKRVFEWTIKPLDEQQKQFWTDVFAEMQEQGYSEKLDAVLNYGIHKAPFELSNANY